MVDPTIGYFLEDIAQEKFARSLVERIANEVGSTPIVHDVRNAIGGRGKVLTELGSFLRSIKSGGGSAFDLLVVMIDANCTKPNSWRKDLEDILTRAEYPGRVVFGIPNPHVERWYLNDPEALQGVVSAPVPPIPRSKCQRAVYKNALRDAFRGAGVKLYLDGAEYGQEIANGMDLYRAGRSDRSFKKFVDELRNELRLLTQTGSSRW